MYLLLSPAKNLNESTPAPISSTTKPDLLAQSAQLIKALKSLDVIDIQELMGVSAKIAELNVTRNHAWQLDFNGGKPAIYLFDGDAYKGLDAYELNHQEITYLNHHLGILSGLYGLVRPLDNILPYRLEMGTKLSVNQHDDLYQFWGYSITKLLNLRLQENNSNTVINLASFEYFKAINPKNINATIITPKFLDLKNGEYKTISFYAKRARGLMTRFCAVNAITDPNELKDFTMEGYYFDQTQSSESSFVFLRDEPLK